MRLIAVLLALWANRYHRHLDRYRDPQWFQRYADWLRQRAGSAWDGPLGLILLVLPPVGLVWLLQGLFDGWLLDLGELLLGAAVLLAAQGTLRLDDCLQRFVGAEQRGDLETARTAAAQLSGDPEPPTDEPALRRAFLGGLFLHSYRHLFGPIFWYFLLGPVGVVLLVSAQQASLYARHYDGYQPQLRHAAQGLLHLLDWIPVRATALALGLGGNFSEALAGWQRRGTGPERENASLLTEAGLGAAGGIDLQEPVAQTVYDARTLVTRALMVWLGLAAVLVLAGWLD